MFSLAVVLGEFLCGPCYSCGAAEDLYFEFLFATSVTRLQFRTLLVAETLPAVGLFFTFSLMTCFLLGFQMSPYSEAQSGLTFSHLSRPRCDVTKAEFFLSVPVIFEKACIYSSLVTSLLVCEAQLYNFGYGEFLDG